MHVTNKRASRDHTATSSATPRQSNRLSLLQLHTLRLITNATLAGLLTHDSNMDKLPFTPTKLRFKVAPPVDFAHYAMQMIHPVTGESIGSYKRLMNNPAMAETWMTTLG